MIVSVTINKVLLEHSLAVLFISSMLSYHLCYHIISGCSYAIPERLNICKRAYGACIVWNIYYLALHRKCLPTPDLGNKSLRKCNQLVQNSVWWLKTQQSKAKFIHNEIDRHCKKKWREPQMSQIWKTVGRMMYFSLCPNHLLLGFFALFCFNNLRLKEFSSCAVRLMCSDLDGLLLPRGPDASAQ